LIVDNSGVGFSKSGAWIASTQNPGYYGKNYLSDGGLNKGALTATWSAPILTAGNYLVQIHFPISDVTRSTAVPVTILLYDGTSTTVTINEQAAGGTWVNVGAYFFTPTAGQYVQISNAGTTGTVVADAVSWTYVPSGGLATPTPVPVPSPIPGYLSKLPFTFEIGDNAGATYFDQTAPPTQVALISDDGNPASELSLLTTGIPNWADVSWADAQPQLADFISVYHLVGFTYDMEHNWTVAAEQVNPALSVQTAGQGARALGLQYWMTTDPVYATLTIEPFAESADVILLPGAQDEATPSTYLNDLVPWIQQARAANPHVKLYAKVDFINGTPSRTWPRSRPSRPTSTGLP
jgi:hypothetical protein